MKRTLIFLALFLLSCLPCPGPGSAAKPAGRSK